MKIGNILVSIGIILGTLGLLCWPIYNFHEIPFIADPGYLRGSGWRVIIQTGIFTKLGFALTVLGGILVLISILLPKKYWKTEEDIILDEMRKEKKKKKNGNAL